MSQEALFGTLVGSAFGAPELGEALGAINAGSKAILNVTEDIPVMGEVAKGLDAAMDGIKSIPGIGDAIDLFL